MILKQNTIYRRILTYFILFIYLPVTIITSILFFNIREQNRRIAISTSTELSLRYQTTVEAYIHQKLDMLTSLSSYNPLTVFLNTAYKQRLDFENYNSTVIAYFKGYAGIYYRSSIRLYVTNETIPEGHGTIYPIHYISTNKIINDFMHSKDMTAIEHASCFLDTASHDDFLIAKNHIIMLHKLTNYKKLTALVVMRLPETEFFGIHESHKLFQMGSIKIINHSSLSNENLQKKVFKGQSGVLDNIAYSRSSIDHLPYDIIIVTDAETPSTFMTFYQLIIFSILLMASSLMLYEIYKMTNRINSCLYRMNDSIQHDFSQRLPIKGNDEITKLSQNINMLLDGIKKLVKRTVEQETIGKETQIFALQNQINPHFIYNTLEIFSSQMELYGHYEESDAMGDFARTLRYNLAGKEYFASVKEETNHMNSYLSIQKIRYPLIRCHVLIPYDIYSAKIIRFIFQPIVENSIQHGLNRHHPELKITITASRVNHDILFIVTDNGLGMEPQKVTTLNANLNAPISGNKTSKGSIGLANINNRLRLFFGEDYRLVVESKINQGTIIRFKIPI